jgi:hypothetical protein
MKEDKALVTLTIGRGYRDRWEKLCEPGWRAYAEKHGYDIVRIDRPLDTTQRAVNRSPAWQKCLVAGHPEVMRYNRAVWLDADIVINAEDAPCVVQGVPEEKVGAVNDWGDPETFRIRLARQAVRSGAQGKKSALPRTPAAYYADFGLFPGFESVVQTGVMVLSPRRHRELLEMVYYSFEDRGEAFWNYEMRPLSHELLKAGVVHWIDSRFNARWLAFKLTYYPFLFAENGGSRARGVIGMVLRALDPAGAPVSAKTRECVTAAFLNSYFLHFAGCGTSDMTVLQPPVPSWKDLAGIGSG